MKAANLKPNTIYRIRNSTTGRSLEQHLNQRGRYSYIVTDNEIEPVAISRYHDSKRAIDAWEVAGVAESWDPVDKFYWLYDEVVRDDLTGWTGPGRTRLQRPGAGDAPGTVRVELRNIEDPGDEVLTFESIQGDEMDYRLASSAAAQVEAERVAGVAARYQAINPETYELLGLAGQVPDWCHDYEPGTMASFQMRHGQEWFEYRLSLDRLEEIDRLLEVASDATTD